MKGRPWAWAAAGALALGAVASSGGCYLVQQGQEQARLLLQRRPLAEALADPALPEGLKAKLRHIQEVKAFGASALGLQVGQSYEAFVPLGRDAVSYVAVAAPRYGLEAHTWWFPVVGAVPYKGYFSRAEAEEEARRLEAEGLDAMVRAVPAFSLLGWLPDPIYQPMLASDEVALSETILHELTHATLFLPGRGSFNEAFASHVGQAGAEAFWRHKEGPASPRLAQAQANRRDRARFSTFLAEGCRALEQLYAQGGPEPDRQASKAAGLAALQERFRKELLPRLEGPRFRAFGQLRLNNAWLASYRTYDQRPERFAQAQARWGGDLRRTVRFFREEVAKAPQPEAHLEAWLAAPPP